MVDYHATSVVAGIAISYQLIASSLRACSPVCVLQLVLNEARSKHRPIDQLSYTGRIVLN